MTAGDSIEVCEGSPYTPEFTDEEYRFCQQVVDQGKEKKRRAKVLREQGGR